MKKRPDKDPNSLGNILLRLPTVSADDLDRALAFHRDNQEVMLGESMVKLGMITRTQLDHAVMEQKKARGETMALFDYGTQRARTVATGVTSLVALSSELALKLKGG